MKSYIGLYLYGYLLHSGVNSEQMTHNTEPPSPCRLADNTMHNA